MEIICYNQAHYGDNVLNMTLLNRICRAWIDIKIQYYIIGSQITELTDFIDPENRQKLILYEYTRPIHHGYNIWIGGVRGPNNFYIYLRRVGKSVIDTYYHQFFRTLLESFSSKIHADLTQISTDLAFDLPCLNLDPPFIDDQFLNLDILFLNNQPLSNQYVYNQQLFDQIGLYFVDKGYRIATLYPINDQIPSTRQRGYTLIQISVISQKCKNIVGMNSGPAASCFTKKNLGPQSNVKFYLYDQVNTYTFNCAKNPKDITELFQLF